MSKTLENIINEISNLPAAERFSLWCELATEFTSPILPEEGSAKGVQHVWNVEIDSRTKQVENGTVGLISGQEVECRANALFLDLGLTRKSRLV